MTGGREQSRRLPFSITYEALKRADPDVVATGIQRIILEKVFLLLRTDKARTPEDEWHLDIYTALANLTENLPEGEFQAKLQQMLEYLRFVGFSLETLTVKNIQAADRRAQEPQENIHAPQPNQLPSFPPRRSVEEVEQHFGNETATRETLDELDKLMEIRETIPSYEDYLRIVNAGMLDED